MTRRISILLAFVLASLMSCCCLSVAIRPTQPKIVSQPNVVPHVAVVPKKTEPKAPPPDVAPVPVAKPDERPFTAHIPEEKRKAIYKAHRQAVRAAIADPRVIELHKQLEKFEPGIGRNEKAAMKAAGPLLGESEMIAENYVKKMVLVPFGVTVDEANSCVFEGLNKRWPAK